MPSRLLIFWLLAALLALTGVGQRHPVHHPGGVTVADRACGDCGHERSGGGLRGGEADDHVHAIATPGQGIPPRGVASIAPIELVRVGSAGALARTPERPPKVELDDRARWASPSTIA